jgi:hypothetical protein
VARIPLCQSIAVTGSINQFGEVQPIGGVIEKVEGFFKVCKLQGLNGRQGCIIPIQNTKHLLLSNEVRQAIKSGQFHIWPVSQVEEAFEILTGYEAGVLDHKTWSFPKNTAFNLIQRQLLTKPGDHHKKKLQKKDSEASEKLSPKARPTRRQPDGAKKKPPRSPNRKPAAKKVPRSSSKAKGTGSRSR